jgi:RNA polymerase sigma-70 factor (ECF subfamily)
MAVATVRASASTRRASEHQLRLERLYEACWKDVYAYLASLLADTALAEDVTASAFERAFTRHRSFDSRRGSERAWLFGIARNAALDELRRMRRTEALTGEVRDDTAEEDHAEGSARRATVGAALSQLSPRERELVALKFHAGLSNPDIARVLGVSETNAGTMLHRTITKLRRACDETA